MNREIKFRVWDNVKKCFLEKVPTLNLTIGHISVSGYSWSQFTGLKDKNGLTEIYEGDILDREGKIIGNQYENATLLQEETNLVIQDFGGKTWCSTHQKALERGCENTE